MNTTNQPNNAAPVTASRITRILAFVSLAALCSASYAQSGATANRTERWELAGRLIQHGSMDLTGAGGSGIELDDDLGFGIEFAYNHKSKFTFGGTFDFITPDYKMTIIPEDLSVTPIVINHKMDMFESHFNVGYIFMDGPITPFVEGGIGFTYFDTNVIDGPPTTGCWWDPWWGYVCNTYVNTYSDWKFSYNATAGLRWDMFDDLYFEGSITEQWYDLGGSLGTPSTTKGVLKIGILF